MVLWIVWKLCIFCSNAILIYYVKKIILRTGIRLSEYEISLFRSKQNALQVHSTSVKGLGRLNQEEGRRVLERKLHWSLAVLASVRLNLGRPGSDYSIAQFYCWMSLNRSPCREVFSVQGFLLLIFLRPGVDASTRLQGPNASLPPSPSPRAPTAFKEPSAVSVARSLSSS